MRSRLVLVFLLVGLLSVPDLLGLVQVTATRRTDVGRWAWGLPYGWKHRGWGYQTPCHRPPPGPGYTCQLGWDGSWYWMAPGEVI